jgi:hypothetical protein
VTSPYAKRGFDWETAGRHLGETLNTHYALVVIGLDPVATGRVAIGIGRTQARYRRVAVGDLFAESPPIQELVITDDPHGLVDSFLYGVSLSKIAYEVPNAGQLFVMPSGSEAPDYNEILSNPRWHRLTAGFREVGALLVLAAPANAAHIEDLVSACDGAILVGDAVPRKLPVSRVIASVREPGSVIRPDAGTTDSVPPTEPTRVRPAKPAKPAREPRAPKPPKAARASGAVWSKRRIASIAGVVLTLALAGGGAWLAYRPLAGNGGYKRIGPRPDTTKGIGKVLAAPGPDTAIRDSGADSLGAVMTVTLPAVKNPADSGISSAFAVELMAANTQAGAILKLQQDGRNLPAATFAPVLIQGSRWFKVVGGAYSNRTDADSLLAGLRRRKVLDAGSGTVVRLPFAFLIDSGVPAAAVAGMVATYADRGQPVYALKQADGTAWLLVGAFESVDQSSLYAESLRASGIAPTLVYRKGRMF